MNETKQVNDSNPYAKLQECELYWLAKAWLDLRWTIRFFEAMGGSTGSEDRHDLWEARRCLSLLEELFEPKRFQEIIDERENDARVNQFGDKKWRIYKEGTWAEKEAMVATYNLKEHAIEIRESQQRAAERREQDFQDRMRELEMQRDDADKLGGPEPPE